MSAHGGGGSGPRPRKDAVDFEKYMEKKLRVKFAGGREVVGILKGYDQLLNLVLDETVEYLRDPVDQESLTGETRTLGLLLARGTNITVICPEDGLEEIENPFLDPDAE